MYCKIIEEVCKEPLGEKQFEKKWRPNKMVFIEPLGGVEIFQGSVENPLRVLGTGEGCIKTLKEYCENFFFFSGV
jgi:hypothetical protein